MAGSSTKKNIPDTFFDVTFSNVVSGRCRASSEVSSHQVYGRNSKPMGVSGTCSSETMTRATDSSTEQDLEVGCSEVLNAEARDWQQERQRREATT
jgi:hypothetical protein